MYGVVEQLDVVGRLASCRSRIALELDPMLEACHEDFCRRDPCMRIHVYAETKINTLITFD